MAKIRLSQGGGFISSEGKNVLLKVISAEYKQDFGKINITLVNKTGQSIQNNFVISRNGKDNEGALKAFSFFARQVMGTYVDDIEIEELIGRYVLADIKLVKGTRQNEQGEDVYFANIDKVYETDKRFDTEETVSKKQTSDDDQEEEGWD